MKDLDKDSAGSAALAIFEVAGTCAALDIGRRSAGSALEAEEAARKVMRMNQPPASKPVAMPTQQGTASGKVQRAEATTPPAKTSSPATSRVNIPGGSPLPSSVRSHMEPRFGADFSNVRIHTGKVSHLIRETMQRIETQLELSA